MKNNDYNNELKYVTAERSEWRKLIRKNVSEIVNDSDKSEMLIAELQLNLNPMDNEDNKLVECAKKIVEHKTVGSNDDHKQELIQRTALLLKHDWERVKKEAGKGLYFANIVYWIVILFISILIQKSLYNIVREWNILKIIKQTINFDSVFYLISTIITMFLLNYVIYFFVEFIKSKCLIGGSVNINKCWNIICNKVYRDKYEKIKKK